MDDEQLPALDESAPPAGLRMGMESVQEVAAPPPGVRMGMESVQEVAAPPQEQKAAAAKVPAIGQAEVLALFSIVVALSAYLATVRLLVIQKTSELQKQQKADPGSIDPNDISKLKRRMVGITLADIPMVVSGVFLAFHLFWPFVCSGDVQGWLLPWGVRLFMIGGGVMALHHGCAWAMTVWRWIRPEAKAEAEANAGSPVKDQGPGPQGDGQV